MAVLGASNYTYAEATRTQRVPDFVGSLTRALTFLGGVPNAIVPDQLKSAVVSACRYESLRAGDPADDGGARATLRDDHPASAPEGRPAIGPGWRRACSSRSGGCSRASATRPSPISAMRPPKPKRALFEANAERKDVDLNHWHVVRGTVRRLRCHWDCSVDGAARGRVASRAMRAACLPRPTSPHFAPSSLGAAPLPRALTVGRAT